MNFVNCYISLNSCNPQSLEVAYIFKAKAKIDVKAGAEAGAEAWLWLVYGPLSLGLRPLAFPYGYSEILGNFNL